VKSDASRPSRVPLGILALAGAALLAIPIWRLLIVPKLVGVPRNFSLTVDLLSLGRHYNPARGEYEDRGIRNAVLKVRPHSEKGQVCVLDSSFSVQTLEGRSIYQNNKQFSYFSGTGKNASEQLGADVTIIFPRHMKKISYRTPYFIRVDPVTLDYVGEEKILGLLVYHLRGESSRDASSVLIGIDEGVPEKRRVRNSVKADLWVEPVSGHIVKLLDSGENIYTDPKTGKEIHPRNSYSNQFPGDSVAAHVRLAQTEKQQILLYERWIPLLLATIAFALLLSFFIWRTVHSDLGTAPWIVGMLPVGTLERENLALMNSGELETLIKQLEAARSFSHGIVRTVPSGLAVLDDEGRIVSTNPAFELLFNREGLKHPFSDFLADAGLLRAIERAIKGEESSLELEGVLQDGPPSALAITVAPLHVAEDERARVLVVIDDVTEMRRLLAAEAASAAERKRAAELEVAYEKLKEAQEMLLRSGQLASLGQLAAGVAHEIRNRLSVISTCHNNIKTVLGLSEHPQLAKMSVHIEQEIARGAQIVNDLMTFARPTVLARTACNIGELVARVLPLVSREMELKDIRLDNLVSDKMPEILVDQGQLGQVLINLLLNAQQALDGVPAGERERVIRIDACAGAQEIVIEISDTGQGIEPEHLARVFDPFFTTKEPGSGTGLGLSVSYGIIERHGGTIGVKSELGQGTTLTIELPCRSADDDER